MKKEIIFFIGSLEVGGAERHLVYLLPELKKRGWQVSVRTVLKKGPLAIELEKKSILVEQLLSNTYLTFTNRFSPFINRILRIIPSLYRIGMIARRNPKVIIHFFLPETYILGMFSLILVRFSGGKIMSRRSLNEYQKCRPILGKLECKLHAKTTAILGNSQAILEQLEKEEKVEKAKLHLIYNGIDTLPFQQECSRDVIRTELGLGKNTVTFIIVANLIPYKGHLDLLEAFAFIREKIHMDWHLLCVGRDDGVGPKLQQQAKKYKLDKHISWLGSRRNIVELFKASDVGILCSHQEGFSNAILEGMAASLPMVVTDVGGNKEAVIDGQTGWVVPKKSPRALGTAILQLAQNPEQRRQFGAAGMQRVLELFTLEICAKAYDQFYTTHCKEMV